MNTQLRAHQRIQSVLEAAVARGDAPGAPPLLGRAIRHAVFPGGARIRPQLCIAVAMACGDDDPALADGAAAAIELLHCASLIHDDLPCFDDADVRRGIPTVHVAYGERLAVLAGDALIVAAFETLAFGAMRSPQRLAPARRDGRRRRRPAVRHRRGTGLGVRAGAATCPTITAPRPARCSPRRRWPAPRRPASMPGRGARVGESLGEAYQAADDIRDVVADPAVIGKPVGRDVLLDRPSIAREYGLHEAVRRFDRLVAYATRRDPRMRRRSVPACARQERGDAAGPVVVVYRHGPHRCVTRGPSSRTRRPPSSAATGS